MNNMINEGSVNNNSIYVDEQLIEEGSITIRQSIDRINEVNSLIDGVISYIQSTVPSNHLANFEPIFKSLEAQRMAVEDIISAEVNYCNFSEKIINAIDNNENKTNLMIDSSGYSELSKIIGAAGFSIASEQQISSILTAKDENSTESVPPLTSSPAPSPDNSIEGNTDTIITDTVSDDKTSSDITTEGTTSTTPTKPNYYTNTNSTVTPSGANNKTPKPSISYSSSTNTNTNSNTNTNTTTTTPVVETPIQNVEQTPDTGTVDTPIINDSDSLFDSDLEDYEDITSISDSVGSNSSTGGSGVIPIVAGLGAAAAVGIGAKVYKDRKDSNELDLNEDRPSNENKFWSSEEDPNVINSEKEHYVENYSNDDVYTPDNVEDGYQAVDNNVDVSKDSWDMDTDSSNDAMVDLLNN